MTTLKRSRTSPKPGVERVINAASQTPAVTGVVFQPFDAVQGELAAVDKAPVSVSYARVDFHPECEVSRFCKSRWPCHLLPHTRRSPFPNCFL
jgi:hypothetical protein